MFPVIQSHLALWLEIDRGGSYFLNQGYYNILLINLGSTKNSQVLLSGE